MDTFFSAFKIFFVFIIAKNIVGIFMGIKMFRKKREESLNSNIENTEKEKEKEKKEMVTSELCGTEVPKNEAYIVVKDGIKHYFCSWECRQKFINESN